jgi:asparaginyl-tRNA synthetase
MISVYRGIPSGPALRAPAILRRLHSSNIDLPLSIKEILDTKNPKVKTDATIEVNGWISSSRVSKNVAFLDIKDGTTNEGVQCVIRPPSLLPEDLKNGTGIQLKGIWSEGKGKQKHELIVSDKNSGRIEILGGVDELFPMIKKEHTLPFLRTIPEYRWRYQSLAALLRFRSQVETTLVNFFDSENFTKTHPPIVTASDCEGAGEMFKIESSSKLDNDEKFFGKDAYLTVSTQLHLEVLCAALNRVWTLTPCFRAEESDTNRHLSEFWMLEAEIAFVTEVSQLTKFSEKMIKSVVRNLVENTNNMGSNLVVSVEKSTIETMTNRWNMLLSKEWDSITYTEAVKILQTAYDSKKASFVTRPVWGDSLKSEHEKWLAGEYFQNPVFVTDYPISEKAFYMKINEPRREGELEPTVACFDLLVPHIGELIGGSMREHNLQKLKQEIERRGMDVTPLQWYLNLRENGSVPHGGFGMGFERLLQYLSCTENIREVIPFPRSANNCAC